MQNRPILIMGKADGWTSRMIEDYAMEEFLHFRSVGRETVIKPAPKFKPTIGCMLLSLSLLSAAPSSAHAGEIAKRPQLDQSATMADAAFRNGDRLKLSFYEVLDSEEAKWRGPNGRSLVAPREFRERAELAGEYTVQEDGSINIPMLGSFPAGGRDKSVLLAKISEALEQLIGRKGYVNILSVERKPIYIIGPVKNPGSFKYETGLTALHAVALAGGMRRTDAESWQNIESRRERVTLERSLEKVKRLIVRTVVLQADGTSGSDGSMKELVSLVGQQDSRMLVGQESTQRRISQMDQAVRGAALSAAVVNYRAELAARSGRLAPFDNSIKLRTERVQGLQQLVEKNISTRAPLVQAQSELADVQDRRQQALIDVDATRNKLRQSEEALGKHNLETRLAIEQAVASAERESADAVNAAEGSLNVLRTFGAELSASSGEGAVTFEIVRRTADGTKLVPVSETTLLEPGDLVRVRLRTSDREE